MQRRVASSAGAGATAEGQEGGPCRVSKQSLPVTVRNSFLLQRKALQVAAYRQKARRDDVKHMTSVILRDVKGRRCSQ